MANGFNTIKTDRFYSIIPTIGKGKAMAGNKSPISVVDEWVESLTKALQTG